MSYSIEEMQDSMTVYFSKRTGEIKSIVGGIQSMEVFGVDKEDYELIWDLVVIEKDEYVMQNMDKFRVDEGNIKLKENIDLSKYM